MGNPENLTEKTVLIVDDDFEIRELTERILKRHGYHVISAGDGKEAMSVLNREIPDIILTDVLMPHMDGYQFFKEVKTNPVTQHIPVLVITGRGQMKETFNAVGVDGFISKPFTPQELVEKVENVLEVSGAIGGARSTPKGPYKILCVAGPEHSMILDQMSAVLKNMSATVLIAPSAAQAVSLAMTQLPGWVFTDIQLPDKRIDEFIYIVKHIPRMKDAKIFGFSYYDVKALDDPMQRKRVLQCEHDSENFLKAGGQEYLGRFTESGFLNVIKTEVIQGGVYD